MNETQIKKRKQIQNKVLKFMRITDKTGKNEERYKKFFASMDDDQFMKWIKKFNKDEDANYYMEVLPYDNEPKLTDIKEASEYLKVPLDEYIYYRHDDNKDNPIRSQYPVPVGYLMIKRLQQTLSKKNSFSLDVSQRNLKTNQLTSASRVARITDAENFSLNTYGADEALKEFFGPRADNNVTKQEMLNDIMNQGYTSQKNYTKDLKNNQTLNTVDVYFSGAGLMTDLVNGGYKLRRTLEGKNEPKE